MCIASCPTSYASPGEVEEFPVSDFGETNWACPAQQLHSFPLGARLTRERMEFCFSSQGPPAHKEACHGLALL